MTKRFDQHFYQLCQLTFLGRKRSFRETMKRHNCVCDSTQAFKLSFKPFVERMVKKKSLRPERTLIVSVSYQHSLGLEHCLGHVETLFKQTISIQEGYACNLLFNNSLCLLYSCRSMDVLINSPPLSLSPLSNLSFHQSGQSFLSFSVPSASVHRFPQMKTS